MEGAYIVAILQEVRHNFVCGAHGRLIHEIAAQATRIVAKTIGRGVLLDVGPFGVDGSEVRGPTANRQSVSRIETKGLAYSFIGPLLMQPPPRPGWSLM